MNEARIRNEGEKFGKLSVNAYKNNLWFAFVIYSVSPVFLCYAQYTYIFIDWLDMCKSIHLLYIIVCVCAVVNLPLFRWYLHFVICRIVWLRLFYLWFLRSVVSYVYVLHKLAQQTHTFHACNIHALNFSWKKNPYAREIYMYVVCSWTDSVVISLFGNVNVVLLELLLIFGQTETHLNCIYSCECIHYRLRNQNYKMDLISLRTWTSTWTCY